MGISYFTFAALGYVIDVYRGGSVQRRTFFLCALCQLFPCIVTGPIERAEHMIPQFKTPQTFDYARVSGGLFRILWGFSKNSLFPTRWNSGGCGAGNPGYGAYTGPILLLASLLYTYQLYCDFSAGCDVALGAGPCLGLN
ncbi:MAG: hypothetical protein ACLSWS_05185 [Faecalispora jeddahensis]